MKQVLSIKKTPVTKKKLDLAVKIALDTSIRHASIETGLSRKRIREAINGHDKENKKLDLHVPEAKAKIKRAIQLRKSNPLVGQMTREALQLGVEKASEVAKDRIVELIDLLYLTAQESLEKTRDIIQVAGDEDEAWQIEQLKNLTSVWDRAIASGQALLGKKTEGDDGQGKVINNIDARSIIFSRIDCVAAGEGQANNRQDEPTGTVSDPV